MTEETKAATTAAGFDAASLEVGDDATTEVDIIDPRTNTSTGMVIVVSSVESEQGRALTRKQLNKRFRGISRRSGSSGLALTAEETESEEMDMLVNCTRDWRNVNWAGKPFACTADNVRFLYEKSPIIRKQVKQAIYDDSLFTKG